MPDRTGLDLTDDERQDLYLYIQERYQAKLTEFQVKNRYYPSPDEKQEIIRDITDEWLRKEYEWEEEFEEYGYYGDIEILTDLEMFLWQLQDYWHYTVYYQSDEKNDG